MGAVLAAGLLAGLVAGLVGLGDGLAAVWGGSFFFVFEAGIFDKSQCRKSISMDAYLGFGWGWSTVAMVASGSGKKQNRR